MWIYDSFSRSESFKDTLNEKQVNTCVTMLTGTRFRACEILNFEKT